MRRRDRGVLPPLRLALLLSFAAALLYAPSAWAAPMTFTVDNNTDATGQFCTSVGVGDCSLRSAVENANSNPGADTINFDSADFTGGLESTVSAGGEILISSPIAITGSNSGTPCGTVTAPKPCLGLASSGNIGFEVATTGAVSINGIAFTGASSAIQVDAGTPGPTVTGSWFGVGLDGTTLSANTTGINLLGVSSATIGGSTAAARNVFSSNSTQAISINGPGGGHVIKGNYFGALPDGTPSSSPGLVGINMFGNTTGEQIGGDAANDGQCDGECNLIDNFAQDGIRTTHTSASPNSFTISGNFIGLGLNGAADQGNGTDVAGGSGIELDQGSDNVTIGGAADTKRNYIAGNSDRGINAVTSNSLNVTNNYIGLTAAGTAAVPNSAVQPSFTGTGIRSADGSGGTYADNRLGGNGMTVDASNTVIGNVIGIGTGGQDVGVTGESGLELDGAGNTVGGTIAGEGNTIGNIKTVGDGINGNAGIFLSMGSSGNTIQGNFIGTTSLGVAEQNAGWGILLGGSNGFTSDTIGGGTQQAENVISNNGRDAIYFNQGGSGVNVQQNVGKDNGSGPNDIFFDIGPDGPGNPNNGFANNGIQSPDSLSATSTTLSGTGDDGDTISVYETYTSHGDIRDASLNSTTVASGTWSIPLPSLPAGQCVTANQTDGSDNSSEMATAVAVGGGSCVLHPTTEIAAGPAEGTSTTDPTPTFGFSSPESGGVAGFECKVDGDAFSSCSGGFTPSTDLSDGLHTFTVRAHSAPSNPGLGPDVGAPAIRTFTVDTTGPLITFTSGPANGSTISTASAAFGFSANEASTFVCKLDGGTFSSCHSPFSVSSLAEGTHTVRVRGTDNLGNVGAVATRSFNVTFPIPTPPVPTPTPTPTPKSKCKKKAKKGQASAAKKKCKKKKK